MLAVRGYTARPDRKLIVWLVRSELPAAGVFSPTDQLSFLEWCQPRLDWWLSLGSATELLSVIRWAGLMSRVWPDRSADLTASVSGIYGGHPMHGQWKWQRRILSGIDSQVPHRLICGRFLLAPPGTGWKSLARDGGLSKLLVIPGVIEGNDRRISKRQN